MKKVFSIIATAVLALATATSCDNPDIYPAKLYISGQGISNNEVHLKAQDTVQIQLAYFPDHEKVIKDNIVYRSTNENVATVSETGLVRGIDTGTASIVVSCTKMPVRYCAVPEHEFATTTLTVHVTGSTLQLQGGEVSQGEAESREQEW